MGLGQSKNRSDPELRLINAAFDLAARHRWREITIRDIAQEAGLSAPEALTIFPSKFLIVKAFSRRVDQSILNDLAVDAETDESPKDRLFDILMRRFEVMSDYKAGLIGIVSDLGSAPCSVIHRILAVRNSIAIMLEAIGIPTSGLDGQIRVHGLLAIYAYCLNTWFRDESADLAATMAAVNQGVSFAERFAKRAHWESQSTTTNAS